MACSLGGGLTHIIMELWIAAHSDLTAKRERKKKSKIHTKEVTASFNAREAKGIISRKL